MRISQRLFILLAVLLVATGVFAQGTGTTSSLSGTVTTDGKPLPGVTVTITSPSMLGTRTDVTGSAGGYNFTSLPPGVYTVSFELEGMQKQSKKQTLGLAQASRVDANMRLAAMTEAIVVTAAAPAVLDTQAVTRNFDQKQIAELPVRRTVRDTVLLSPGVNSNGPNNQITISGGPSYDNLFLVNGVVVNENLRGQPHNLFIEDAIQETTILTGAISAEYGRFTGGVVSTITKSGGNEFSGSLRDSMTNPKWISKTAFADPNNGTREPNHPNVTSQVYEGTLGGFALKDKLWFFGAGRHTKGAPANGFNSQVTTLTTNIPFQNTLNENRYEGKLTGQLTAKHNLIASYLNVKTTEINNFFAPIYDTASIVAQRELPNSLKALSYNGVITSDLLLEGQVSQKKFAFINSGGLYKDRILGTWIADSTARFNAPVFCGVCTPEDRNNDSASAKASYYLNTRNLGAHNLAIGGELYKETRLVNNNQSASDFTIGSTGTATFLAGDPTPYPHFDSNTTLSWRPILINSTGDHLNTKSVFVNDKWDLNNRLSFNIGMRYDKNHAVDATGNLVSDDSKLSPRLGAIWDVRADGRSRINVSYAKYTTKIVDGNVGGAANAAGTPASFTWTYRGPVVNPIDVNKNIIGTPVNPQDALRILFNWFDTNCSPTPDKCGVNSTNLLSSNYPGYTTRVPSSIASPNVDEYTVGFGQQFGHAAFARADLIHRKWNDFYALQINQASATQYGTITAPNGTVNDVAILVNDNSVKRTYDAAQLTFSWRPQHWNIGGGYTYAKLRGNDTTESDGSASSPLIPSQLFYPEFLSYANRLPTGYLYGDQTHRGKVWAGYDFVTPHGTLNTSVIQNADSGRAYSAVGTISIAPGAYTGAPTRPSYYTDSQLGAGRDYYFSTRGQYRTPSVFSSDLALNYDLPLYSKGTLFVQGQVINIFNNSKVNNIVQGQLDTTVRTSRSGVTVPDPSDPTGKKTLNAFKSFNPFSDKPVECPKGASAQTCFNMNANFQLGPTFGQGLSKDAFQTPRTYRLAVGVRF